MDEDDRRDETHQIPRGTTNESLREPHGGGIQSDPNSTPGADSGLRFVDESGRTAPNSQSKTGHTRSHGPLLCYLETSNAPFFSNLLADFVAHALFLLYERRDNSLAKSIIRKFDQTDGVLHGLVHLSSKRGVGCDCPACFSRRSPRSYGPWVF